MRDLPIKIINFTCQSYKECVLARLQLAAAATRMQTRRPTLALACALACAALLEIAQGFAPPAPLPSIRRPRACTRDLVSGVRMQADSRQASASEQQNGANGVDPAYPYLFDGRLWFRPAIVRVPENLPAGVAPISLFGYSLGLLTVLPDRGEGGGRLGGCEGG